MTRIYWATFLLFVSVSATAQSGIVSVGGQVMFPTGLGNINQILGPTDEPLQVATQNGQNLYLLPATDGDVGFPDGSVYYPSICPQANAFGICLYWTGTSEKLLAWRDCTGGSCPSAGNQVSAGLDDQGIRIVSGSGGSGGGAIRFIHNSLTTGTFTDGGIMTSSGGTGTLSLCAGSDCDGTVPNPHTGNLNLANLNSYGTVTFNDGSTAGSSGFTFATALTLPNGSVATTQSAGDNSTKLATTAYVRKESIMTFGCSVSAPITSVGAKNCSWTTPAAVTIIQFDLANVTAPAGCSTYGTLQVWDDNANAEVGSYSITLAASSSAYTAVTGSTNVAASHVLRIKVTTAAAGCSPNAAGIFGTISYQMQN
jgi:hypothetical protein